MVRHHSQPLCIGQKQKWFLLKLKGSDKNIRFDLTESREFDGFRWVRYWYPLKRVIIFKKNVYRRILREFSAKLFPAKIEKTTVFDISS